MSGFVLPSAMIASGLISAGAVGGIDLGMNGSIDPKNIISAYWVGALTRDTGFKSTVMINAAGGATTSYIDGKKPFLYGTISGLSGAIGYGIGNKFIAPVADDIINPTWKTLRWDAISMGISKTAVLNPLPGVMGTVGGGSAGEAFNILIDPANSNIKRMRNE
ncbi:adhesin [Siccibacter colletis]|uniref:adhesin n=1 Tax=Siccibacter colletis TaxID=1505757 RepID=UPI0028BDEA07|nr:adhesin [Siccibacter colletis]WNN48567.1 adhesin [Siccibacter colletis]